jgi:protein O-GlcNAc transferase
MPKISLCMIVKNEEANLAACLGPVWGLVHEIIIVDTGSTDRTKEVAAQFGARVFDFPWCDDFSAARNESLRHACGDWVFWLDADDRLDDANVNKLQRLFGQLAEPAGYHMTMLGEETPQGQGIKQVRLFKLTPKARWQYRVHEQIAVALLRQGYPLYDTDIIVRHTGYPSPAVVRRKCERNLPLLLLDLAEHPNEPIVLFHLGMTYVLLARFAEAIPYLEKALRPLKPHYAEARFVFRYLVDALRGAGRVDLALQRCLQGLGWFPDDLHLQTVERLLATSTQKLTLSLPQALDLAKAYYEAGRWQQAEQCYQQILHVNPNHADALHLLGLIAAQTGRGGLAVDYLQATLRLKPDFAAAHNNLGNVLVLQGQLPQAVESFRQAVRCQPDFAAAHSNLGNALRELGRLEEAVASLREAVRLRPDSAEAHNNLAAALLGLGKPAEALASCQQALRFKPDFTEAANNLRLALQEQGKPSEVAASDQQARHHFQQGHALTEQGKYPEAAAQYQQALRLQPESASGHNNLGNVLALQGKLPEAVASYRQAVRCQPDFAAAHSNLGNALRELGRLEEAVASLQEALRLQPDYTEAHYNLAIALRAQGKLDEALASSRQAIRCKPDYAEAHLNLGNILKDQGRLDEALAAYRTCLNIQPHAAHMHSNLVLTLHYHPGYDAAAIYEECRRWNQQHAEPLSKLIQPHTNQPNPERRLRIGYVSPVFRDHASSFFTIPLLSNHDHRDYEIVCYSDGSWSDDLTERHRRCADIWRSTAGLSDEQLAELVRSDQVDILVDLAMHTANNRLLVFARKPAPVQVAWLGYPGTTGLSTIDYRLTDPYLDPPGLFDASYSEQSVRLPDTFWCYDPLTDGPPVNSLPALENGIATFGCLNNFCKINDTVLALWAQVLQAVPQSRLLLLAPPGEARERVSARLLQEGLAAERIEFATRQPRTEYLGLYHRMDLCLDPLPYNGHTTSLDALWMGVPTITLVSKQTAFGRAGWSQLCNLGLQEWAAETAEQYVALAAQVAGDLPRLQELRTTLRQRMQQSPLMDGQRFARHVEQAYRQMWRRWCHAQQPFPTPAGTDSQ